MRIALVQVASPAGESPERRRERVGEMVLDARGADLVVLPELWAVGYFAFDAYARHAETLSGPTVAAGRDWARRLGAHVHLGSVVERDPRGRLFNTAVLIGPDGAIRHTYRKTHVFGYASREAELLTPGGDLEVVTTDFGGFGATTCYDLRFPELWRGLVDRGAEVVAVPAAWPAARREHWRLFTTCRAVEEQLLLIACNAVGTQAGDVELAGHSRVVDPWGTVLAEAGTDEGITLCEADPATVGAVRAEFPVLADRRWPPTHSAAGSPGSPGSAVFAGFGPAGPPGSHDPASLPGRHGPHGPPDSQARPAPAGPPAEPMPIPSREERG